VLQHCCAFSGSCIPRPVHLMPTSLQGHDSELSSATVQYLESRDQYHAQNVVRVLPVADDAKLLLSANRDLQFAGDPRTSSRLKRGWLS
jgi:hypothetical protein